MIRPSFATTIAALTLTDPDLGVISFDDCGDVAEALRYLECQHRGGPTKDVGEAFWGRCSACGERWPCEAWVEGERLAVQFLGRAQDRVAAHARETMARTRPGKR